MWLPPPVTALLTHLRRRDRGVCVAGRSALEHHTGRAPSLPIVLAGTRSHRLPRAMTSQVSLRRSARPDLTAPGPEGVPVQALLPALLRVLGQDGATHDAELLVAASRALDPDDRARLARLASARGCSSAVARATYVVGRATGTPSRARPASSGVWLRPGGLRAGAVDSATGVRVNAPDGAPSSATSASALLRSLSLALDQDQRALVQLTLRGAGLDRELADHVVGPAAGACALDTLRAHGLVAGSNTLRLVAPLDVASPDVLGQALSARALEAALAFLDAHAAPERRLDALRVRLALGRPEAPAQVLDETPAALERGQVREVELWMGQIADSHPDIARAVRIRVLERQGRLREALALARDLSGEANDPRGRVGALIEHARLAWRSGRAREAEAALARALRGGRRTSAVDQTEVLLLRASIALEGGRPEPAREWLERARGVAESSGDEELLARVLRRIGTLDARAGRPLEAGAAYRAALAALRRAPRLRDPSLEPLLLSNLATIEGWVGHYTEAESLYREALARRASQPLEALNTRAALALLDASRGRRPASGAFGPLVEEAERLGEPRLRVELAVYRAEELVTAGELGQAAAILTRARVALAELGGAEVVLESLVRVAEGTLAARRGEQAALEVLADAGARLIESGARYHAARAARAAASAAVWLGAEGEVLAHVERSASLAREAGIVLGDESRHVVALALAATKGSDAARTYARVALGRLGAIATDAELRRRGRGDLALALAERDAGPRPGALLRAIGPDGPHLLSSEERDALCGRSDLVVLDRSRSRLYLNGTARNLDRMRHVEPLLAHLVARRPEAATLDELARVVWAARPGRSVVAAITTSIARLRALLGPHGKDVVTLGSGARRAYGLEPGALFWRVDGSAS